jgi:hypothetical protein
MHAKAVDLGGDPGGYCIFTDDPVQDRAAIDRLVELARTVVDHRAEKRTVELAPMPSHIQIGINHWKNPGMDLDIANFVTLALDLEIHHAFTTLHIPDLEPTQFLATNGMIEQGGEDGAITHALERVRGRRIEQLAGLSIAQGRRFTFVAFDLGSLNPSTGLQDTALRSQR